MKDLNKVPYATWLERSLRNIIDDPTPTESICIITKSANGDIGTGYFNCAVGDMILFAGYLQQDAMLDTLRANGQVEDEETEEEE